MSTRHHSHGGAPTLLGPVPCHSRQLLVLWRGRPQVCGWRVWRPGDAQAGETDLGGLLVITHTVVAKQVHLHSGFVSKV